MELSKLKVCFLAGTLGQGGAERQLFYKLSVLRACGADVRLLCLTHGFWEDRIKGLGVPVIYTGSKSRLKCFFRIVAELRRYSPAIFQSAHFYTSAYVGAAARLLRIPGVGAMRSDGFFEMRDAGRIRGWLNLRSPQRIVANSHAAIRFAIKHGVRPERLHFLGNVVDTAHWKAGVRSGHEGIRLIGVGRFYDAKRFDRFLSVLARLRRDAGRPVTGVLVGDGPLRAQLEKDAHDLGLLPGGVEFKGNMVDVAPIYREADICVLTSEHEGTPNVLLEAMSSGLPVVATRVGGVPGIIKEGETGFVVDDEAGLYAALLKLVDDPAGRAQMGQRARSFVEQNHALRGLPGKLADLYRQMFSAPFSLDGSRLALHPESMAGK